ncbi:zinc ribbon domain-containing protein [Haloarcula marina]|uniref:zinc ribbon domain-containing protein n=1 Tax=Haloarcula marina TaxID=2961574 RepID=UPI0020B67C41|nr:zinc ribbon domain-containing protein [Halomicroarcula marina]
MDEWRADEAPSCPACGESAPPVTVECPSCGEQLLPPAVAAALDERMDAAFDAGPREAPRWAVLLTGLALGVAISPLVGYAVVIAVGGLSLPVLAGLLFVGWVAPAAYLSRLPNPSAALARGLYLVVAGVGAVVLAVASDALSGGPSVVPDGTAVVVGVLGLAAVVALLLARRVAGRAARQARGEPGPLHEMAGLDEDETDDDP